MLQTLRRRTSQQLRMWLQKDTPAGQSRPLMNAGTHDSNTRSKRKMNFSAYTAPGNTSNIPRQEMPGSSSRGLEAIDPPLYTKPSTTLKDKDMFTRELEAKDNSASRKPSCASKAPNPDFDAFNLGLDDLMMPSVNDVPLLNHVALKTPGQVAEGANLKSRRHTQTQTMFPKHIWLIAIGHLCELGFFDVCSLKCVHFVCPTISCFLQLPALEDHR